MARPLMRRANLAATWLLLSAHIARAQRITGRVQAGDDSSVVRGAVVTATDSAGQVIARLLTDISGRFTIDSATAARTARLRVIRIGFVPASRVLAVGPTRGRSLEIAMARLPVLLATMRVRETPVCHESLGRDTVVLRLWDQARAAMSAAVVAQDAAPGRMRVVRYRLTYDDRGTQLLHESTRILHGATTRPFGAAETAGRLAETGFVVDSASGRTYLAPDAEVLLDPAFASTHCFRPVLPRSEHAGEVGLSFVPAKDRDGTADIRGTLWLNVNPPRLDSLGFRFTNIEEAAADAGAGGSLTFTSMPNGVVVISHWELVAPRLDSIRYTGYIHDTYWVAAVHRIGGWLTDAAWPDGVEWHAPLGVVSGEVTRGGRSHPADGATVWIEPSSDSVVTDTDGRFSFRDLPPGDYVVRAVDPRLEPFHAAEVVDTSLWVNAGWAAHIELKLQSDDTVAARMCSADDVSPRTAVVLLTVEDSSSESATPVTTQLIWTKLPESGSGALAAASFATNRETVKPRGHRRLVICGVTRGGQVSVRGFRGDTVVLDTIVAVSPARGLALAALAVPGSNSSTTQLVGVADSAAVIGYVADTTGAPVAGATITADGGTAATTNAMGDFVLRVVGSGPVVLRTEKQGFQPVLTSVTVPHAGRVGVAIVLKP